ncbi:MAG: PilN domain-containing protein [Patescibacteria group bacterium]
MMITLNLLSAEQQKKARRQKTDRLLKQFALALTATTILIAAIFILAKETLQTSLSQTLETYYKSNHTFNIRINQTNALLKFIREIKVDNRIWSELLVDITKKTPADVKISALEIDGVKRTIALRGLSLTRDSLLSFKDNLNQSKFLTGVNLPVQSLAQKENIIFVINAALK